MKNIILLITDTFRYDNLENRAERPVRTPELDKFKNDRATEITHFVSGSYPTIPHRTDVTSGKTGWPFYGWQSIFKSTENEWPKMLADQGYVSQLICDCPHLFKADFQQGFTASYQHRGQEGDIPLLHLNDPIADLMPFEKTRRAPIILDQTLVNSHRWGNRYFKCEDETFCHKTASTVSHWLEENYMSDKPFFLWVDLFDPHEPWDPPEYLVKRYDPDYDGTPMIHPNYGPSSEYTERELRNLWAHYAAESELIDRSLGRIIQKIDDLALWDDSIVVVTADHGISIGEHARTGKSNIHPDDDRFWPIYPEINHIPFLVAGGDVPKGETLDLVAQPIDILPTLSELAGVKVNPPEEINGRSFAEALLNKSGEHREIAISSSFLGVNPQEAPACACTPFITSKKWGFAPIGANGEVELYDLENDPLATRNIAEDHPETVKELGEAFLQELRDLKADETLIEFWRGKLF